MRATHGVHVTLPTARPRGKGRVSPPSRVAARLLALGVPRRTSDAQHGSALLMSAAGAPAPLRKARDIVASQERPIPVAKLTASAPCGPLSVLLPRRP